MEIYTRGNSTAYEPIMTKTITYKCGCEVKLNNHTQYDADFYCLEHGEPIIRIVTV